MGAPQIIVIVLLAMEIGWCMAIHGREKTGKHDGWSSVVAWLLFASLLYWGEFFGGN